MSGEYVVKYSKVAKIATTIEHFSDIEVIGQVNPSLHLIVRYIEDKSVIQMPLMPSAFHQVYQTLNSLEGNAEAISRLFATPESISLLPKELCERDIPSPYIFDGFSLSFNMKRQEICDVLNEFIHSLEIATETTINASRLEVCGTLGGNKNLRVTVTYDPKTKHLQLSLNFIGTIDEKLLSLVSKIVVCNDDTMKNLSILKDSHNSILIAGTCLVIGHSNSF
jgi:hypothetical protein